MYKVRAFVTFYYYKIVNTFVKKLYYLKYRHITKIKSGL